MRHYTDGDAPVPVIRPPVNRSQRVDSLRQQFPLLKPPPGASSSADTHETRTPTLHDGDSSEEIARQRVLLQQNKEITQSPLAQRLAWDAFSTREKGRIDRGREAMLHSGLWDDDLGKEARGVANNLPDWRKGNTGQFVREEDL